MNHIDCRLQNNCNGNCNNCFSHDIIIIILLQLLTHLIVGSFDKLSVSPMRCFPVCLRKSILESQKGKISSLLKLLTDTIPKMTE